MAFKAAELGALAFAAVSVKAAYEWDRAFAQIQSLTNVTDESIAGLKDTVMGLSRDTAVAPADLAHAMYFLASAGLTVTQQMESLDAVAHGAAIGLGAAGDLARITANALNTFSDNGLKAADVMDTLVAAIREGTAEPDEFATALGRVLPIADNAGISFQQVAASLAVMSNAGLDTTEGVTSLRAILQSLVAPTAQTESAFQAMGLTVDQVVSSMKNAGIIDTLRMVSDAAKANTDSQGAYNQMMRHAIPNIRGLAGALNLTGQDMKKVDAIYSAVINSTGDAAEAFRTFAESDAFKVNQALNKIRIAGQQLATNVLPLLAKALGFVADNADEIIFVLAGVGIYKIVAGLQAMSAAALESAAATAAEASASVLATEAIVAEGEAAAVAAIDVDALNLAAAEGALAGAGLTEAELAATGAIVAEGEAAAAAAVEVDALAVSTGAMAGAAALLSSGLVAVVAEVYVGFQALKGARKEFDAFSKIDFSKLNEGLSNADLGTIKASFSGFDPKDIVNSITEFVNTTSFMTAGIKLPLIPDDLQIQQAKNTIDEMQLQLSAAGKTAEQQSQIFQTAMAAMGGSVDLLNPDQMKQFSQEVINASNTIDLQAQAAAQAKQQILDATKATQAADEATKSWQVATAQMTDKLTGLSAIGIDVNSFMAQLQTDLAGSDDQAKTFADAIDQVTKAWYDFQAAAVKSLTFAPQALSDLTSAAQGAQDQLDGMTSSSTTSASELATLRDTANLTGQDILKTFQDARAQTIAFGKDLLEVSRVGGQAGKDLAASLMESGNVMAAQIIADSPGKLQRQIVEASGASANAADKWGTKLTDAIAGPLDDIVKILKKLAFQAFGISVDLNDHGAKKQVDDLTHSIKDLPVSTVIGIKTHDNTAQQQVDHLASSIKALPASTVLDIKAHIHAGSPWPDEALKMHLYDPIKRMGFKQIAGRWTLPLDVAVHSDGIMPHRITNVGAPSTPNYTAAIDAFTSGAGGQVSSILSKLYPNNGDAKTANLLEKISHEARQTGKLNLSALKDLLREQKSAKWVSAWADQAQRAFAAGLKAEKGPPKWYDLATKNVPKLPEGTHGHKDRHVDVRITRPHMDDAMSYQTDYSGF